MKLKRWCYNVSLWQIFVIGCSFNGREWFLNFLNKNFFFLRAIYLLELSELKRINEKFGRRKLHESTNLILGTLELSRTQICSAMRWMISWWVKTFLSLFITFRTNFQMSIIPLPMFIFVCSQFEMVSWCKCW